MNIGIHYTSSTIVTNQNTAKAIGSGNLDVFATPALVALMENAAMNAVMQELPTGSTTVGSMISTTHTRPSKLGSVIQATATLTAIEGRKLTFKISAHDENGTIGEGEHIRYIVDVERFMTKVNS